MDNYNSKETKQIDIIEARIKEALREIQTITMQQANIKDANDLEALEKEIIKATDKLAGLITAKKLQQALDSEEVKRREKELVKNLSKSLKNQGQREVEILTSRGGPVKIKATYYSKKKKSKFKKKKL